MQPRLLPAATIRKPADIVFVGWAAPTRIARSVKRWAQPTLQICLLIAAAAQPGVLRAADPQPAATPRWMLVGPYGLPDEAFLKFAQRVRPDVIVMGTFGPPQFAAQSDVGRWLDQWSAVFERMHASGIRVVGMMELMTVADNPQQMAAWIDFFDRRWDAARLGPRPDGTAESLVEKRDLPAEKQVGADAPRGCVNNPHFRQVQQALLKAVIDAGIDGLITHRNIFGQCACPFCHADREEGSRLKADGSGQRADGSEEAPLNLACDHCNGGFRRWLAARYDEAALARRFNIRDLKAHPLEPIVGHHRRHDVLPDPLALEAMRFARHAVKHAFDEVFVAHGRKLKPDLIVAQWNHMPYFDELHSDRGHLPQAALTTFAHASADERWSLPMSLWGRGEDFYWYCNWGTCQNTQLDKRFVGDVTLYARLLRSQARGKPYVINKYDFYRPRNMLAEAAGLGMMAGAIQVPYAHEDDAASAARWFDFFRRHAPLYQNHNGEALAQVLLVYPRTATHAGDASGLEMIEVAGRTMIVDHVLFDLVSDDLLAGRPLKDYRAIVAAEPLDASLPGLTEFRDGGGRLIGVPRTRQQAADPRWKESGALVVAGLQPHTGGTPAAEPLREALRTAVGRPLLTVDAPFTVQAHLYQQGGRLVLHLVNYNHEENAVGQSQVEREAPLPAPPARVQLTLPPDERIDSVSFLDPDSKVEGQPLKFEQEGRTLTFTTPRFLVYGVCVMESKR